jgi:hypothetical protein
VMMLLMILMMTMAKMIMAMAKTILLWFPFDCAPQEILILEIGLFEHAVFFPYSMLHDAS